LESRTAEAVVKHLSTLGIVDLAEWDLLTFIYGHAASLAGTEKIAALVGYTKAMVRSTLESLTVKGLVMRSRNSRGVRLYRSVIASPGDPVRLAFDSLLEVAEDRRGRLLIAGHLRKTAGRAGLGGRNGLHLA
jgi:DNA-binding MarR family transcriptional regulator